MFLQVLTVTMPAKFELKNVPLSPVNYSTQLNKLEPTSYAKKKKMLAYIKSYLLKMQSKWFRF